MRFRVKRPGLVLKLFAIEKRSVLMKLKSKLPDTGTTIFTIMSSLANEHGAINLSQGFPDFGVSEKLIGLVEKYMKEGFNQYAPMQGVPILREKIALKVRKLYGADYDPDKEITITSGATEALFAAISAVVQKGDEVILFEPAYDSYAPAIRLSGGQPVHVKLRYPDYSIDWEGVNRKISEKTRLMVLNSPQNPAACVLKEGDIKELKKIVEHNNIFILSDEVYEHIIFDGRKHESMTKYPELAEKSFVVFSFGKTYHTTGWKTGYCLAPENMSVEFRKIHQYLVFSTNTAVQMAYADFMDNEDIYLKLGEFYQKKRDLFLSKLKDSRFKPLPCSGSYFQMLDYSEISDLPDTEFARYLTMEHKVASIPPSVFYKENDDHKVLRFCFAKEDRTLEQAADRLCLI